MSGWLGVLRINSASAPYVARGAETGLREKPETALREKPTACAWHTPAQEPRLARQGCSNPTSLTTCHLMDFASRIG